ncbi:MAG TPA: phage tail protein [Anaerolineae bacterium]|nr:phage tail protein [Anaerolineae bacterium]
MAEYPLTNFNFLVHLNIPNASGLGISNPLCQMEFAEVDGLEMTMEPKTVREGGNNTQQTNLVGPVTYGNLTLKRGVTSNLDLWTWFAAATGNTARATRASGVIVMQDSAGQNRVRIDLFGCLPIKVKAPSFNAKDGQVAIEELQIAVAAFRVAAA